jgi:hypothetical protein
MIVIVKRSKMYVYVSPRNLGLSSGEVGFSPRNNHVHGDKELKLP